MLTHIALNTCGRAEFSDIIESTGIPERSAWRFINQYREQGILDTVREKTTKVFFKNSLVWEQIKEALIILSKHFDFGFKHEYGSVFFDSCIIRSQRKNKKKPIKVQPVINITMTVLL